MEQERDVILRLNLVLEMSLETWANSQVWYTVCSREVVWPLVHKRAHRQWIFFPSYINTMFQLWLGAKKYLGHMAFVFLQSCILIESVRNTTILSKRDQPNPCNQVITLADMYWFLVGSKDLVEHFLKEVQEMFWWCGTIFLRPCSGAAEWGLNCCDSSPPLFTL